MKKNIALLSLAALFTMLLTVSCTEQTPQQVALDATELFVKGDYTAFVNTFTTSSDEEKAQANDFFSAKGQALIEQRGAITKYDVAESDINEEEGTGTVKVSITYEKDEPIELAYDMAKINGRWVIKSLK